MSLSDKPVIPPIKETTFFYFQHTHYPLLEHEFILNFNKLVPVLGDTQWKFWMHLMPKDR